MRDFSITNDHLKTVVPAQAGISVSVSDEMGLSATNLAGGGFRKHAAATHFLLLRQKKVTKEKATRVHRPLRGFPALLAAAGHSHGYAH
jgi:hypothetical protein